MKNSFIFLIGIGLVTALPVSAEISTQSLFQTYWQGSNGGNKLKVLIVPGHDNEVWGTEYKGVKEVTLNRMVATKLAEYLKKDKAFDVTVTQENGDFTPEFATYFKDQRSAIADFRDSHISAMAKAIENGSVDTHEGVKHNSASDDVSIKLYGINKWANEHDIDLVIHIHFNDYGGRKWNTEGEHEGFTVYVPEKQLGNAQVSRPIADSIFAELIKYNPISDLSGEAGGVTEDQQLIAVGSHNTLSAASLLIEYGYIYEPDLASDVLRTKSLEDRAYRTYLGIKNFFEPGFVKKQKFDTNIFPFTFKKDLKKGLKNNLDAYALQTALANKGIYPPGDKTFNDCPINGSIGPCTLSAIKAFQSKYKLPPTGLVGAMTRKILNTMYSK